MNAAIATIMSTTLTVHQVVLHDDCQSRGHALQNGANA